ncbi:C-X-C chemokine receptor type 4a [Electrophorus electricus]|uniref:G-protein coupled receptors family 1 profile domain-containing protein n=1 Tax=Electrophorus electricus TaxID=8005 RepID=A0A4W4HCM7_ELEEL|nr:C-X-C chemokine receptor type 4a [Electrophorus electricus]
MSYYEHIIIENDGNISESGLADLGIDLEVPCNREVSQDFQKIFLPTVYGIIFFLGFIGNGLVVLIMGYQNKSRTMTDKYRLHLSVADLLFVLSLPFWAVDAASDWYFGGFMCVAMHMIYTVNLYSSVLILAFISLDRYLAVVRATSSQAPRKLLAERAIYVGVWLPAALLTVPDLVFARTVDLGTRVMCERIYPAESNVAWMVAFRFQHILVGFVLPGFVILVCYCIIISKLSRGSKGTQKRKALKTTVVLIVCFFGCWLPYCGGILIDTLMTLEIIPHSCELEEGLEKWIFGTEALAYFHCCLNPILYAFLGVKFKKSARNALLTGRGSSLKSLPKKRCGMSSVSTESESSSFHSS